MLPAPWAAQLAPQLCADGLEMREVTEASSPALSRFLVAAAGFPEVAHRRQLRTHGQPEKPAVLQVHRGLLCVRCPEKLDLHLPQQVIA